MGIWIDIGCDDFEAAARNRVRIKSPDGLVWWYWYESVVRRYPRGKPLPYWIPTGKLPTVGGKESKKLSQFGFHNI